MLRLRERVTERLYRCLTDWRERKDLEVLREADEDYQTGLVEEFGHCGSEILDQVVESLLYERKQVAELSDALDRVTDAAEGSK